MGKPKKQRAGRRRLREAFEKLAQQQHTTEENVSGRVGGGDDERAAGTETGAGDASGRLSRVDRRVKKVSGFLDKVGQAALGVRSRNMKKKAARARKRAVFSFGEVLDGLGEAEAEGARKASEKMLAKLDVRKQSNRLKMMAEFKERIHAVHNNAEFQSNPLATAMKFLEETLPPAPSRQEINQKWRQEQALLDKKKKKGRPKWHDK